MSCSDALAHLPARELEPAERDALLHGRAIAARGEDGPVRCLADGRLVCVAGPQGAGATLARRGGRGMKIVEGLEQLERGPRVIALGTFDGVHLGHRRLIHEALERAQELGAISTVATFEPMPSEILRPGQVAAPALRHRAPRRADRARRASTSCS